MPTIRNNRSLPSDTRSVEARRFATSASRHAANSTADPSRIIEKLCALLSLTFAVSLGRIQEERQRGAIKLITNLTIKPLRGTAGFAQQRRYPRDESKLNLIYIPLFMVEY
jgi:hypothetical protein